MNISLSGFRIYIGQFFLWKCRRLSKSREFYIQIIGAMNKLLALQSVVEGLEEGNKQVMLQRNITHKRLLEYIEYIYPDLLTPDGIIDVEKAYELMGPYAKARFEKIKLVGEFL